MSLNTKLASLTFAFLGAATFQGAHAQQVNQNERLGVAYTSCAAAILVDNARLSSNNNDKAVAASVYFGNLATQKFGINRYISELAYQQNLLMGLLDVAKTTSVESYAKAVLDVASVSTDCMKVYDRAPK